MTRTLIAFDDPDSLDAIEADGAPDAPATIRVAEAERALGILVAVDLLAVLGERTQVILDELETRGLSAIMPAPERIARVADRSDANDQRDVTFAAQTVLVGWDDDIDRVVIEAWSLLAEGGAGETAVGPGPDGDGEDLDDDPLGPDVVRIRLTPAMAGRFAQRLRRAAGGTGGEDRQR